MKDCYQKGPLCGFPASKACGIHGPALRKGKPWFDRSLGLPPGGLTILPSPESRWKQIVRAVDSEYERCRDLGPDYCRKMDPWTAQLAKALDVDFSAR